MLLLTAGPGVWQLGQQIGSALAADLEHEVVASVFEHLRERDVVAALGGRAGAHRDAEAGVAGLRALDRDDEDVLPPGTIGRIGVRAPEQHAVEDAHRMQLARAGAQERVARGLARGLDQLCQPPVLVAPRAPQPHLGRQLVALPRVRADVVAEQGLVVATAQPVVAALLLVGPADRQVSATVDLVIDDRAIAHGRTEHGVAATMQRCEKLIERIALQRVGAWLTHAHLFSRSPALAATVARGQLAGYRVLPVAQDVAGTVVVLARLCLDVGLGGLRGDACPAIEEHDEWLVGAHHVTAVAASQHVHRNPVRACQEVATPERMRRMTARTRAGCDPITRR